MNITTISGEHDQFAIDATIVSLVIGFHILTSILGVLANSVIILTIIKSKYLRTAMNITLVNLAIADIIVCAVEIPSRVILYSGVLANGLCKSVLFFQTLCDCMKPAMLAATSFERYQSIARPLENRGKLKRTIVTVVVSWLTATAVGFVSLSVTIDGATLYPCCSTILIYGVRGTYFRELVITLPVGFVCLSLVVLFYCLIIKTLSAHGKRMDNKPVRPMRNKIKPMVNTVAPSTFLHTTQETFPYSNEKICHNSDEHSWKNEQYTEVDKNVLIRAGSSKESTDEQDKSIGNENINPTNITEVAKVSLSDAKRFTVRETRKTLLKALKVNKLLGNKHKLLTASMSCPEKKVQQMCTSNTVSDRRRSPQKQIKSVDLAGIVKIAQQKVKPKYSHEDKSKIDCSTLNVNAHILNEQSKQSNNRRTQSVIKESVKFESLDDCQDTQNASDSIFSGPIEKSFNKLNAIDQNHRNVEIYDDNNRKDGKQFLDGADDIAQCFKQDSKTKKSTQLKQKAIVQSVIDSPTRKEIELSAQNTANSSDVRKISINELKNGNDVIQPLHFSALPNIDHLTKIERQTRKNDTIDNGYNQLKKTENKKRENSRINQTYPLALEQKHSFHIKPLVFRETNIEICKSACLLTDREPVVLNTEVRTAPEHTLRRIDKERSITSKEQTSDKSIVVENNIINIDVKQKEYVKESTVPENDYNISTPLHKEAMKTNNDIEANIVCKLNIDSKEADNDSNVKEYINKCNESETKNVATATKTYDNEINKNNSKVEAETCKTKSHKIDVVEMDGTVHKRVQVEGSVTGAVCVLSSSNKVQGRRKVEMRAAKRIAVLIGSYMILWLPLPVMVLCAGLYDRITVSMVESIMLMTAVSAMTTTVNPTLNLLLNKQIRSAAILHIRKVFTILRKG